MWYLLMDIQWVPCGCLLHQLLQTPYFNALYSLSTYRHQHVSTFHMDWHLGHDPCIERKDNDQEPQEGSGGAVVTCRGYGRIFG